MTELEIMRQAYVQQKLPGMCRDSFVGAFMTPKTCMFLSLAFRYCPDVNSAFKRF